MISLTVDSCDKRFQEFPSDTTNFGLNLKDFHGFNNKIADVIRNSVRPVLQQCEKLSISLIIEQYFHSANEQRNIKGVVDYI